MCVINDIKLFVFCGFKTFRKAAKGNYDGESEAVGAIRQEMYSQPGGRMGDAFNMNRDRLNVGRDARVSFKKIVATHG